MVGDNRGEILRLVENFGLVKTWRLNSRFFREVRTRARNTNWEFPRKLPVAEN